MEAGDQPLSRIAVRVDIPPPLRNDAYDQPHLGAVQMPRLWPDPRDGKPVSSLELGVATIIAAIGTVMTVAYWLP